MMGSLLRTLAILMHDIAQCVEEVQDAPEPDDAGLVQLTVTPRQQQELFGTPLDMQLRALRTTLELMDASVAMQRASSMAGRMRRVYASSFANREEMPNSLAQLEALLVTFMPEGSHFAGDDVCGQDREWLMYWWSILARHLPGPAETAAASSSSGVAGAREARWRRYMDNATTAESRSGSGRKRTQMEAGLAVMEARRDLTVGDLHRLETIEQGRPPPDPAAGVGAWTEGEETADDTVTDDTMPKVENVLDTQDFLEAEVARIDAVHERLQRQRRAAAYQSWEDEVMREALQAESEASPDEVRVVVRGGVGAVATGVLPPAEQTTMTQSMQFALLPGQQLVLHFQAGSGSLTARSMGRAREVTSKGEAEDNEKMTDQGDKNI